MGQYFQLVETEKREFASPWALGSGAKLWEWCANTASVVVPYMLVCKELAGKPSQNKMLGRWANGSLALVGDYDDVSNFYEGCETFESAVADNVLEMKRDAVNALDALKVALRNAGIEGDVFRAPKDPHYFNDPRNRYRVRIPTEATDEQVIAFLKVVYPLVNYARLTVASPEFGPHGQNWREIRVSRPWTAEGEEEKPLEAEVKNVVMNLALSYQIGREYNICGAPWTGEYLRAWAGRGEEAKLVHEEMEAKGLKGMPKGKLVKSAEDRVKEMLPLPLYLVNHTVQQVLSPSTLGIAGTIRDWCKCGWAGVLPFLLRKSVGDGGGDGMSEDDVAGKWAMQQIELRPDCPAGYEDVADIVGPRYNQYIEIPEYRFPMAKGFKGKRVSEEGDTCPPTIVLSLDAGPEALIGAIAEGVAREGVKK